MFFKNHTSISTTAVFILKKIYLSFRTSRDVVIFLQQIRLQIVHLVTTVLLQVFCFSPLDVIIHRTESSNHVQHTFVYIRYHAGSEVELGS